MLSLRFTNGRFDGPQHQSLQPIRRRFGYHVLLSLPVSNFHLQLYKPYQYFEQTTCRLQNVHLQRCSPKSENPQNILFHKTDYDQILLEIEQKSQFSSQQITIVKGQMAAKARENRMLQLTASEVGVLPRETHIYEGIGKM